MSVDFLSKNFPPFQVHHAKKPPRFYPDGFQRNVIDFYFIFSDCRLRKALYLQFSYFIWPLVTSRPKMSISILVLQIRMPIKYHKTAFPFEISHNLCYTKFWRYTDQHMDVIWASLCLYDCYPFLFTQSTQYLPYIPFDLPIYRHPPIFRRKHHMILASPCCVCLFLYIFFFHRKNLLVFVVAVGRPQPQFYQKVFSLYNLFYSPQHSWGLSLR